MATAGTENAPVSESESHVPAITRVARVGSPVTPALGAIGAPPRADSITHRRPLTQFERVSRG